MGMNAEQTASTSQVLFNLLNMLATQVASPTPPNPTAAAPCSQPPVKGPVVVVVDKTEDKEGVSDPKPMDADGDLTDGSTDSEAEAKAATANQPWTKIKKKKSRGGKGSQGKGGPADTIKATENGKLKNK